MTSRERPILFSAPMIRAILSGSKSQTRRVVKPQPWILAGELLCWKDDALTPEEMAQRCPYGMPGDRLWVREAWCASSAHNGLPPRDIPPGDSVEFLADGPTRVLTGRSRRAFHMPRWACRILLEVTGVRVERLGQISDEDARCEGVANAAEFQALWRNINNQWEPEQWVWVIQFQKA